MIGVLPVSAFVALVIIAFAAFGLAIYEIALAIDRRDAHIQERFDAKMDAQAYMLDPPEERSGVSAGVASVRTRGTEQDTPADSPISFVLCDNCGQLLGVNRDAMRGRDV